MLFRKMFLLFAGILISLIINPQLEGLTWDLPAVNIGDSLYTTCQVAVDSEGNAAAVWIASDGSHDRIQASFKPYGQPWEAPIYLSEPGYDTNSPQIAAGSNGEMTAVWLRYHNTIGLVQASTRSGGKWQATPDNLSDPTFTSYTPQVAGGSNGEMTAVWAHSNGSYAHIEASTRSGGMWQATPDDLSAIGQNAATPQIAAGSNGEMTAVWIRSNGSNTIVQASTRSGGGAWQLNPNDLSAVGQNAVTPQIAGGSNGEMTAAWIRSNGSNTIVQASTRSGGVWSAPTDVSPTGYNSTEEQLACDTQGNLTVVWTQMIDSKTIQAQTRSSEGVWGPLVNLSSSIPGTDFSNSHIGIDGLGNATVIWASRHNTQRMIQAATTILPPLSASGKQVLNQFPMQKEYFNELQWTASPSSVIGYHIYRNGTLIATVSAFTRSYRDQLRQKGVPETYVIKSVTESGGESVGITVVVP